MSEQWLRADAVEATTADWAEWEVRVPHAMTDPGSEGVPPTFEDTWMQVESVTTGEDEVAFYFETLDDPIAWSRDPAAQVEIRKLA